MMTIDTARYRLDPNQLRWFCDPEQFGFDCTNSVEPLEQFIGQDRALRAIDFGLNIHRTGYNIFVTGLSGSGRATAVKSSIESLIQKKITDGESFPLYDWCYIFNFDNPDCPNGLRLKAGEGKLFAADTDALLKNLKEVISKTFASDDYKNQKQLLIDEHQRRHRQAIQDLEKQASDGGFAFRMTSIGPILVPMREGKAMTQEQYVALDDAEKEDIENHRQALLSRINKAFENVHLLESELKNQVAELDRKVAGLSITPVFVAFSEKYSASPEVRSFLNRLQDFTLSFIHLFRESPESQAQHPQTAAFQRIQDPFNPFRVNVFVDNAERTQPPIIQENHPNWSNLFGRIERRAFMGTYFSDHTMLKSGALHQANGGYIIMYFRDLIVNPGVWDGLKRVLKTGELKMEDPWEQYGLIAPQGLKPDPLPFQVKVVLIADDLLYRLLTFYDEEFRDLFKVKADFDTQILRTDSILSSYACFVKACCDLEKLLPFDRGGVAKSLEYASRMISDQNKLTSRLGAVKDLLIEADFWSRQDSAQVVSASHVQRAIEEKRRRHGLIEERLQEYILADVLFIDTDGAVPGQINGLSVTDLGDYSFGRPSRITVRTYLGKQGIVNIERESRLSGRIHDKGVMILGGYLGYRYAQNKPLSLAGSVCFEQSYEGVEGDSASLAETCALLSSLVSIPLRQDIAVTGSINQKGEVQPVGGVNQKIEGFFKTCEARGLSGTQGVIIPTSNVRNLMLEEEVVQAVREGRFHVYAVRTVDEALEILSGMPVGERREDGNYDPETFNDLIDRRLRENVLLLRRLSEKNDEEKKEKKENTDPAEEKSDHSSLTLLDK
ncbi:MAG TPA: ATP-binding protein [Atribacteraceae bacterium]|nr:ATP-binding protein [Atribacteraceae bacterium]